LRIWLEDRGKRCLPFIVGFVRNGNYLLVFGAGIVNVEELSAFRVLVIAVNDQAATVRSPRNAAKVTDTFTFGELDLKRRIAAAVRRDNKNFLLGPAASERRCEDGFVQIIRQKNGFLF